MVRDGGACPERKKKIDRDVEETRAWKTRVRFVSGGLNAKGHLERQGHRGDGAL